MASHFLNFGSPSIYRRRSIAQILFFMSGLMSVFLFGGVESWAKGVIAVFLAGACLLEATIVQEVRGIFPRKLIYGGLTLMLLFIVSLIPVPIGIAEWIYPGQVRLLKELPGFSLNYLHGSMAPIATVEAWSILLGAAAVCYLSWLWADESFFRRTLIFFLLVSGCIVAFIGIYDLMNQKSLLYSLRTTSTVGQIGPFVNRNHFSNYVNFSVLLGLGVLVRYGFPRLSYRKSIKRSLFGLFAAVLCGSLSIASLSRGGILSLVIGLLIFIYIFYRQEPVGKSLRIIFLIFLIGTTVVMVFGKPATVRLSSMVQGQTKEDDVGRLEIWKNIFQMTRKLNGLGSGAGTFEWTFPIFQTVAGHRTVTHAENEYLQTLAEWGVIGSVVWFFLFFVVLKRGLNIIRKSPREWEIAGWSALAMMAVHMLVDFPLHISANAWVAMALLGILLRGHTSESEIEAESALFDMSFRRGLLLSIGIVLVLGIPKCFSKEVSSLEKISSNLEKRNYGEALRDAKQAIEMMPFYWMSHEYAAYAAAGNPGFKAEVLDRFRCAQQLSRANPLISLRAGLLFLNSEPAIARDFFEEAMQISPEPLVLFTQMVADAAKQNAVGQMIPLAMRTPDRWLAVRQHLNDKQMFESAKEAADYWLNDLEYRQKVVGAIITGGQLGLVVKSFQEVPPRTKEEAFFQARAYEILKESEQAVALYSEAWRKYGDGNPQFSSLVPLTPSLLERATREVNNLELQWNVAESLFASSQHAQSIEYWSRGISYKKEPKAWYALAIAYQELGGTGSKDYFERSAECWRLFLINTWKLF